MVNLTLHYPPGVSAALLSAFYDLPLLPNPWQAVGTPLGETGQTVLSRLQGLLQDGFIRDVGPMFHARSLGYQSTLVAGQVPTERLETVTAIISEHPGVSHNYLRECDRFNLWFTLSVRGPATELSQTLTTLSKRTGVKFRKFDALERYKISFRLSETPPPPPAPALIRFNELDSQIRSELAEAIELLQQGLHLVDRPFLSLAESVGTLTETELIERAERLKQMGLMRRLGVFWRHRQLGLRENVLCVWRMPESRMPTFAERIKTIPNITHGYRRETCADWPWAIYTMIHGNNSEQCRAVIKTLRQAVPEADYLPLRTLKEYKKSRVIYRVR